MFVNKLILLFISFVWLMMNLGFGLLVLLLLLFFGWKDIATLVPRGKCGYVLGFIVVIVVDMTFQKLQKQNLI